MSPHAQRINALAKSAHNIKINFLIFKNPKKSKINRKKFKKIPKNPMHTNDKIHKSGMFYGLICVNNHKMACVSCMLSAMALGSS